jgi:adenylate cyclase
MGVRPLKRFHLKSPSNLDNLKQSVEELLKLKPEITTCARVLIGHYIKFVDIIARIIDGLLKVGLNIE